MKSMISQEEFSILVEHSMRDKLTREQLAEVVAILARTAPEDLSDEDYHAIRSQLVEKAA